MYKILVSDKISQTGLDKLNEAEDVTFDVKLNLTKQELMQIVDDYDALIIRSGTRPDAEIIEAGKKLKIIGRAGMGVDHIDINAATHHGIIVMNTPGANSTAIAEHTISMMLNAARHTPQAHASLLAGNWHRSHFMGSELAQKVLGIIGFGRIGRLVASRAQAFDMKIITYDPFVSEEIARKFNVTLVDLDELYTQADIITLHAAVTPETINMINQEALDQMKNEVILVNVARGKLINEADLAEAVKKGKVKSAAVDVYSQEPPQNNPLIGLPNVIHTPHLGASTKEAQRAVAGLIIEQVLAALRGEGYQNAVNLPLSEGVKFEETRPYMQLAEKIGKLQFHLADKPIKKVEIEVSGSEVENLIRPIAAGILKGMLEDSYSDTINYINAPILADEKGIVITQAKGLQTIDYSNKVTCKVYWRDGERSIGGVLFANGEPRIVQVDKYRIEAKPEGNMLILANKDVPGVVGQIGTLLAAYEVNIGEWRMGRHSPGSEALSFINLDNAPPPAALDALERIKAVTQVNLISL